MYDILPFPNVTGETTEERLAQMLNYLIQLKEELEFALTSIDENNLSKDLVAKLNSLGAGIEKSNEEREDQIRQISVKTVTVSDVVNSAAFKAALPSEYLVSAQQIGSTDEPGGINIYVFESKNGTTSQFTVKNGKSPLLSMNYETGNLEYEML